MRPQATSVLCLQEAGLLEELAMQGDVRGVGHIRSVMAESSFTRDVHDSQHVLLGTKVQIQTQIRASIEPQ